MLQTAATPPTDTGHGALLEAAALVYSPDRAERRQMAKITARNGKWHA